MNLKYHRENLKDNKMCILFHTINEFNDIKTKNKFIKILNLFKIKKYYIKVQTLDFNLKELIERFVLN